MTRRTFPPSVRLDITEARSAGREAILLQDSGQRMNPGEARRLADDLLAAAAFVDQLAPPHQLKETSHD